MSRHNNERRKNDSLRQEIRDVFKGLRELFDALEKEIEKKEIKKKEIEKKECEKKEEKESEKSANKSVEVKVENAEYFEASSYEEEPPACLELSKENITSEVFSNLTIHVLNHVEQDLLKFDIEFSNACPMETKFKECFVKDDIVEEVDFIFPFPLDIQIKHALDSRTNPFEEGEDDTSLARATSDPNKVPAEFVERTRAMEFEDGINGLVQRFWAQTNSWRPIELNYSKWGLSKVFGLRNNECSYSNY